MDGIYSMTFRGAVGWGMGVLVLRHGIIVGADAAGALYDGTFTEDATSLEVALKMIVPPGAVLVQGTPPQAAQYEIPFNASIPKQSIEANSPVLVQLPPGPVNVIFKLLRSLTD